MHTYPKNPIGLNKEEHYAFADKLFSAYAKAVRMSAPPLTRAEPNPPPEAEKAPPRLHRKVRAYRSPYAGVTIHRGRWLAVWGAKDKPIRGKVRELTSRGERWAAQDRARGLEREWLEMRDGTREVYRWKGEKV